MGQILKFVNLDDKRVGFELTEVEVENIEDELEVLEVRSFKHKQGGFERNGSRHGLALTKLKILFVVDAGYFFLIGVNNEDVLLGGEYLVFFGESDGPLVAALENKFD